MSENYRFTLASGREICGKVENNLDLSREFVQVRSGTGKKGLIYISLRQVATIEPIRFSPVPMAEMIHPNNNCSRKVDSIDPMAKKRLEREIEMAEADLVALVSPPCKCCPADIDSNESQGPR